MHKKFLTKVAVLILPTLLFLSSTTHAYLAIGESGEVVPLGNFQFNAQPQFFTNEGSSANILVSVDTPWTSSASSRFTVGGGKMNPTLGASIKWIPFPDVDRQPAIGGKAQVWYARYENGNILTFQLAPLISRKMDTDVGLFIPYFAVPFNFTNTKDRNYANQQFVLGTEWKVPDYPQMTLGGEVALNLKDSFSFFLFTFSYQIDASNGLQLKR
ncbi:MAG: hypothetical protein V4736_13480 [Bdellovibrionota bacterium]